MTQLFTILSVLVVPAAFLIGLFAGQRNANATIEHERSLVVNLQAQNDGLQTRMLTMLDETIKGVPHAR